MEEYTPELFTLEEQKRIDEIEARKEEMFRERRNLDKELEKIQAKRDRRSFLPTLKVGLKDLRDGKQKVFILPFGWKTVLEKDDLEGFKVESKVLTMLDAEYSFSSDHEWRYDEFELHSMGEFQIKDEMDQVLVDQAKENELEPWDLDVEPELATVYDPCGTCKVYVQFDYITSDFDS